jgi:hypothetical protein
VPRVQRLPPILVDIATVISAVAAVGAILVMVFHIEIPKPAPSPATTTTNMPQTKK